MRKIPRELQETLIITLWQMADKDSLYVQINTAYEDKCFLNLVEWEEPTSENKTVEAILIKRTTKNTIFLMELINTGNLISWLTERKKHISIYTKTGENREEDMNNSGSRCCFHWHDSKQGHDYWHNFHMNVEAVQKREGVL